MMKHHHNHYHPHVIEYLRRDIYPLIREVVTPLIYNHFNLKFASSSIYISLLFCRLFHLFFKLVRYVLRVFRSTVVAEMLPLTIFTPRYLDFYCVISDFESEFLSLRILTTCFENHLTCFDCYKYRHYCSNLYEILIFL